MAVPNMVAGMTEAFMSSIPLVAIAAQHDESILERNPHGGFVDHVSLLRTCTKWTHLLKKSDSIPEVFSKAFRYATSGRPGPVAIIAPSDIMGEEAISGLEKSTRAMANYSARFAPPAEGITAAVRLLIGADRPIIIAGGGVLLSQAWPELIEVAETLMIPVATTLMGKGSIPDSHPLSVGVVGTLCDGENGRGKIANQVVNESDVVLLVGTKTDQPSTKGWTVPRQDSKIIQIDIDVQEIGRNYPQTELGIVGDAKTTLAMIRDSARNELQKSSKTPVNGRIKAIQKMISDWRVSVSKVTNSDERAIRPERIMKELGSFIDAKSLLVADAGSISLWAGNYIDVASVGRTQIYPRGLTALGSGYPLALGAKVGAPDRQVFSVHGDGAFSYTLGELETAARCKINVVSIVLNNKCLVWEKWDSEKMFGRYVDCDLTDVRFDKMAEAAGCFGRRVTDPGELKDAITAGVNSNKPAVIDVVTSPNAFPPYA